MTVDNIHAIILSNSFSKTLGSDKMKNIVEENINKRKNLNNLVTNYIKESILYEEYKEGDRILEENLSTKLGISRAPIREGIRELEQEGIITSIPRKGSYITTFTSEDINEIFSIRLLIENDIIETLIKENELKEKDFENLNDIVEEMVNIVKLNISENEKYIQMNAQDIKFHNYIWRKSGSERRVKILNGLFFQLKMAMIYDMKKTNNLLTSATDHYKVIDALKIKNISLAKKELEDHIITYSGSINLK